MPNCDFVAKKDFSHNGGVGGDEDVAFVGYLQVVEIHDVTRSAEGLTIFAGAFEMLIL